MSVFNFEITNHLKSAVELSPASSEGADEFESCGDVVIQPPVANKRVFPKIDLSNVYIAAEQERVFMRNYRK